MSKTGNKLKPCESCLCWVNQPEASTSMGLCCEGKSEHFGHYLWGPHPVCDVYRKDPEWPKNRKKKDIPF